MIAKSSGTTIAKNLPKPLINPLYLGLLAPNDWNALAKPCNKWNANTAIEIT